MAGKFLELALTESVCKAQEHYYGGTRRVESSGGRDTLTEEEKIYIESRDSFYIATVTETGWPYVQHRGGPPGFLHVLDSQTLAFADYKGNRQLLSTGNLASNDRVALFLMDYARRERLKILGHVKVQDAREHPDLAENLAEARVRRFVERFFYIDIIAFDWNCSQYITPRYTAGEVSGLITPLQQRVAELEAQLEQVRLDAKEHK